MTIFGQGQGDPKWLAQVKQMVVHNELQNKSEKCTQQCQNGPKMADFVPKKSRLAIGGQGGPKWLANVEQMVVLNGIHAGGLPWAQNLLEKCTQWCQNGSKMAHFGPKCQF